MLGLRIDINLDKSLEANYFPSYKFFQLDRTMQFYT